MYEIKTHDFYKTGINKKVIGMFKDEAAGKQITHFVGLRPKLYKEQKKCKGIKKMLLKKNWVSMIITIV